MADLILQHIVQNELWWSLGLGAIVASPGVAKYYLPVIVPPPQPESVPESHGHRNPYAVLTDSIASLLAHPKASTIKVTVSAPASKQKVITETHPENRHRAERLHTHGCRAKHHHSSCATKYHYSDSQAKH
jgi:hypothetical protein